jgi:hypothetical protein
MELWGDGYKLVMSIFIFGLLRDLYESGGTRTVSHHHHFLLQGG